ncbi:MAG TPA: nitroreductase family protein [Clostridia bacterium]|nr:nitroreductase family protein [Clostridia bacterium]
MYNSESFYTVVEKRRSVRNFKAQAIEQEKLDRILECGLKAPSHNHMREWHYILLRDEELRKDILENSGAINGQSDRQYLDSLLSGMDDENQKQVYSYSVPIQERMLLTAPEILLVCFRMNRKLQECETLYNLNNFASAWLVIENILLAMATEGLYGVTMVPFRTDRLKNILGMPDDFEIASFIPFGYPQEEPELMQIKKELKNVIHIDKW